MWLFSEPQSAIANKDADFDVILNGPVKAIPSGKLICLFLFIMLNLGWTNWDKIDIEGPKTLEEVFLFIKEKYGVTVSSASIGKTSLSNPKNLAQRLKMTPEEIYKAITEEDYPAHKKYIEIVVLGETEDGVDANMPLIRYKRN